MKDLSLEETIYLQIKSILFNEGKKLTRFQAVGVLECLKSDILTIELTQDNQYKTFQYLKQIFEPEE